MYENGYHVCTYYIQHKSQEKIHPYQQINIATDYHIDSYIWYSHNSLLNIRFKMLYLRII